MDIEKMMAQLGLCLTTKEIIAVASA